MRILLIGATGTIGSAVAAELSPRHEIVPVSRSRAALKVDLADPESIRALYRAAGPLDAVICAAGRSRPGALEALDDAAWSASLANKLMGQINLVRFGMDLLAERGSFTLTGGMLAHDPSPGSVAIATVNAALEGFVRGAALDLPRGLRVNLVSPHWVSETLLARGMDPDLGAPVAQVAALYAASLEGGSSGSVFDMP